MEARITQHWARLEYTLLQNPEAGRKLMEEAMRSLSTDPFAWLGYINLERFSGGRNMPRCRSLYSRACNTVVSGIELIANSWLEFESDEGTPEQWKEAQAQGAKRISKINERKAAAEQREREEIEARRQKEREKQQARRKRKKEKNAAAASPIAGPADGSPAATEGADDDDDNNNNEDVDGVFPSPPPQKVMKIENEDKEAAAKARQENRAQERNERTVHVSGLSKSAEEEDVKKFFSVYGIVIGVRMGKNKSTGELAGYCFVVFSSLEGARNALRADGCKNGELCGNGSNNCLRVNAFKSHDGHRENNADSGAAGFSGFEPRTLFLTNIPFEASEGDIAAFFKEGSCGGLKSAHIVKDFKTGKPRVFAYAEFETEEEASAALRMDKKPVLGTPITVRRSRQKPSNPNPQPQEHPEPQLQSQVQPQVQVTPQITLFKPRGLRK